MKINYYLPLIFVFFHSACHNRKTMDDERIPNNKSVGEFRQFDAADYKTLMEIKDGGIRR